MSKKKSQKKKRVDQLLFERGLASSLKEAAAFVYEGLAYTNDRKIQKPSEELQEDVFLGLKKKVKKYVSRAGEKLHSALEAFSLTKNLQDKVVLDIGSSTGGFTDCALKHGAKTVIALDVGTNQLVWELRQSEKVLSVEKTHIKDFQRENFPRIDFVVADISFNSLAKLAPSITKTSDHPQLELLLLVKPQFELPKEFVSEKGLVTKKEDQEAANEQVKNAFEEEGFSCLGAAPSAVKGRTGNQETFLYFRKR